MPDTQEQAQQSSPARFEAFPLQPMRSSGEQRTEIISRILRELVKHETLFTDYQSACDEECLQWDCEECGTRLQTAARMLNKPDALVWEVWDQQSDEVDLAGILYCTSINYGCDAQAHYAFFDGNLRNKTRIIKNVMGWLFRDHENLGWKALKRLTIIVPDFAYALARHAVDDLGFGGRYSYSDGNFEIPVEGVKEDSILWRGEWRDQLILGQTREQFMEVGDGHRAD